MYTDNDNGPEQQLTLPGVSQMPGTLPERAETGGLPPQTASTYGGGGLLRKTDGEGVRMEKVVAIQAALLAGNYGVPVKAVAGKMLEAMLNMEREQLRSDRRRRPRVGHRGLIYGERRNSST